MHLSPSPRRLIAACLYMWLSPVASIFCGQEAYWLRPRWQARNLLLADIYSTDWNGGKDPVIEFQLDRDKPSHSIAMLYSPLYSDLTFSKPSVLQLLICVWEGWAGRYNVNLWSFHTVGVRNRRTTYVLNRVWQRLSTATPVAGPSTASEPESFHIWAKEDPDWSALMRTPYGNLAQEVAKYAKKSIEAVTVKKATAGDGSTMVDGYDLIWDMKLCDSSPCSIL